MNERVLSLHSVVKDLTFYFTFPPLTDVPSPPGKPNVVDIDSTSMTISWSPPESDGGTPITGYLIEKKDRFSPRWTKVKETAIMETVYTVVDLKEGTEYQFRVIAKNKVGESKPSEPSDTKVAKPPYGKLSHNQQRFI